jgi:hypothetical protein
MKELEGRPSLANIPIARSFHERNGKKESLTGMLCGSFELVKKTVNRIVNHAILTNNHDVLTVIYTFAIIKVAQSRGKSNSNLKLQIYGKRDFHVCRRLFCHIKIFFNTRR